ncbi:MAG: UDP-N-acetylglucosamine 1-carboxyvinyltransferase [Anaplasmataceae bacterium]|nr:UDP-N-acetylglucosamine 1-carboxyvinyltransferase [Anaplasmataceae bacterium]
MSRSLRNDQQRIGRFISNLREERGVTQAELAEALHTSQSAVARMEKGEQNFTTEMLSKISQILNREIISLGTRAINFQIEGGHKLHGVTKVKTSKNSAVGLLCASLLNREKTIIKNIARIEEVNRILEVLSSIGMGVRWISERDVELTPPEKFELGKIDVEAAMKTRSVIMMIGPLIHLLSRFSLPHPGGCKLGKRTILPHLLALKELGVEIEARRGVYQIRRNKLRSRTVPLYEMGDTTTENILMAAAKIPGKTVIKFASANYQVQDLCHFLVALGVRIEGIGTSTLVVHGKEQIQTPLEFQPGEDPIEAMLFISIAATTRSEITIQGCPIDYLELELLKLKTMGFRYKILKEYLSPNGFTRLVDIKTLPSKLIAPEEKLHPLPSNAGINIDNLPFFVPIATQAKGRTLIQDWVYENRAIYYMELNKLGANVILADPHRVYVEGPTPLRGAEVVCPPALRPAVIILIAMLAAEGTSILRNVYSINRGYEDLCARLCELGAKVKVLRSF